MLNFLGVTLAFRCVLEYRAEGQICAGAIAASYFAYFHNHLPQGILLSVMAVAAIITGGLWGMLPAYFKTRFGTNETLFTLMLNYIIGFFITYLREGPWRDPQGGFAATPRFLKQARLPLVNFPGVGNVHIGWIVMFVILIWVFFYLRYTNKAMSLPLLVKI